MLEFIQSGGPFMYAIAGLSIVAMAIILEKFYTLNVSYRHRNRFFNLVVSHVKSGDVRTALSLCHKTSHPLARILVPILNNPKQSREAMESAISVEVKKVAPNIQKRTGYLQMIGNVATLVGLLGTIQGLIISFSSLSGVSAAAKAELLATGISTAMNTTAFGLIVAIPCLVCFAALANKETRILQKYEEVIGEVLHALLYEGNNRRNDPYAA